MKHYLLTILSSALLATTAFSQVQFNQIEGFGVAVYDINNQGHGIHGNGYYDFATNNSMQPEANVTSTVAINDAEQILGTIDDGEGNSSMPAYQNNGTWTAFSTTAFTNEFDYTLYDISENGTYVVGQLSNTSFSEVWGFIYNTESETLTILSDDLYEFGAAYGVNNSGTAVGWVQDPISGNRMASYFQTDGTISVISTDYGEANAINQSNQVVGVLDGEPFIFNIDEGDLTTFTVSEDFISVAFADISDNGVAIGYGSLFSFDRVPMIYHPDLGSDVLALADVLSQFGVDATNLVGTAYRISSDGNYIAGWGNGPAFMAPGWAIFFDDLLFLDSPCSIDCIDNIVVDASAGELGAIVNYELLYSCEGEEPEGTQLVLINGLPTGAFFPLGSTTVYHELQDGEGNFLNACSFTVTVNDTYCDVNYDVDVEPITNVEFAGIANQSSATVNAGPAHEYFTDIQGTVQQSETYPITVEGNSNGPYDNYYRAYFDWNQNGDFGDDGEAYDIGMISNSTGMDGQQATADILVPADALIGVTRMRVVKNYNQIPTDPCGTYNYGQTEDYSLLVEEGDTGLETVEAAQVSVYPNPVANILHFDSQNEIRSISIVDITGKIVMQASQNTTEMDVRNLSEGIYIVQITLSTGQVKSLKMVKN